MIKPEPLELMKSHKTLLGWESHQRREPSFRSSPIRLFHDILLQGKTVDYFM